MKRHIFFCFSTILFSDEFQWAVNSWWQSFCRVRYLCCKQSEEKCVKLQASLTDAEEKLSSKFPDTQPPTPAGTAAPSQVIIVVVFSTVSWDIRYDAFWDVRFKSLRNLLVSLCWLQTYWYTICVFEWVTMPWLDWVDWKRLPQIVWLKVAVDEQVVLGCLTPVSHQLVTEAGGWVCECVRLIDRWTSRVVCQLVSSF